MREVFLCVLCELGALCDGPCLVPAQPGWRPGVEDMKMILGIALAVLLCLGSGLMAQEAPSEREAKLIAVLKSDADGLRKTDACVELGRVGTAGAVPALAALLTDERLTHAARHGLEQLEGPAADEALRTALGNVKGVLLVGVIDSLGVRRDPKAVEALTGLLKDADATVIQAAARALGAIGTEEAAKGLGAALAGAQGANQQAVCEGLFRCAEALAAKGQADKAIAIYDSVRALPQTPHQVRTGAWRGAILMRKDDGLPLLSEALRSTDPGMVLAAARIAREGTGAGVVKLLTDEIGKLPPDRQVLVAGVLGQRQEAAALPALFSLAKAGDKTVRVAALKAALEIGDSSLVVPLIELSSDPEQAVAQAAAAGLAGLRGAQVDDAVIQAIEKAEPALKAKLVDLAGQRRITKAMPVLGQLLECPDEKVRLAAIKSYGEMAGMTELPGMLAKLEKSTRPGEIDALGNVIRMICSAAKDPNACAAKLTESLGKSVPEAKPAVLKLLSVAGGASALKAVRAAVDDSNKDVHTAAIRVLSEWKSVDAALVLLELAKNSAEPVDRILALRGYLGLAMQPQTAPDAKLGICREAAPMIQRPEEKRLMLAVVSGAADPRALGLIVPYLNDADVKQETVMAILAVAEKRAKKQHLVETKTALEKVVAAAADKPDAVKRAEKQLAQIAAGQ